MIGRAPCLDGQRNRRNCRSPIPSIGYGRFSRYPRRTAPRLSDRFRSFPNSQRVTATDAIYTTVTGRGFPQTKGDVWVDSCIRSMPPRTDSISRNLSRPLSLRSLSRCPEPAEGLSKGRRRTTTGYRSAGISTSSMNALRKYTSRRCEKCRLFVTPGYILAKMAFITSHDLEWYISGMISVRTAIDSALSAGFSLPSSRLSTFME